MAKIKSKNVDRAFCRKFCCSWHGDTKKNGKGRCMGWLYSGVPEDEWICHWDSEAINKKLGGME